MAFLMGPLTLHLRQRRDSIESSFLVIWNTFEKIFFELLANDKFSLAKNSEHNSRSLKWEPNGELAQKDLSELIEKLKNVENEDTSSELSRLGSKSNIKY